MTDPRPEVPAEEQTDADSGQRPVLTADEEAQTDDPVIDPSNS